MVCLTHNEIGVLGEDIASSFLEDKGLEIIDRNYWKKWGEIDIVARETTGITHFVEVKSVTREKNNKKPFKNNGDMYRPEDNIHPWKVGRLRRVIATYIESKGVGPWVFDVVVVYINVESREAECKLLSDIIL